MVRLPTRQGRMPREAPKASGPHGNHDTEVAAPVGIQQYQHGGPLASREGIPYREGRRLVGTESGERSLGLRAC